MVSFESTRCASTLTVTVARQVHPGLLALCIGLAADDDELVSLHVGVIVGLRDQFFETLIDSERRRLHRLAVCVGAILLQDRLGWRGRRAHAGRRRRVVRVMGSHAGHVGRAEQTTRTLATDFVAKAAGRAGGQRVVHFAGAKGSDAGRCRRMISRDGVWDDALEVFLASSECAVRREGVPGLGVAQPLDLTLARRCQVAGASSCPPAGHASRDASRGSFGCNNNITNGIDAS